VAADTNSLLKGILNCVARTEQHIAEINKKVNGTQAGGKSPSASVADTIKGAFGKSGSSSKVEQKLDKIIELLSGKKQNSGPNEVGDIGSAIGAVSTGLKNFSKVAKTSSTFTKFLKDIISPLGKLGSDKIDNGVKNLDALGKAILSFSKDMFKAGLMFAVTLPLMPVIAIAALGFGQLFVQIGKKEKDIAKGANGLQEIGKGLILLAGGIALFTLSVLASSAALSAVGFPTGAIGVIAGIALTAVLIGMPPVQKGVKAMKEMGKGLLFLAGGIAILTLTFVLSAVAMQGVGMGGAIGGMVGILGAIGGLALMMVLLGLPPVAKGAQTMKGIGVGMLFLAGGIAIMGLSFALISMLTGVSAMEVGAAIALTVLGIGGAMWLMGKQSEGILKGSIGLIFASIGLVIFAYGLKKTFDALQGKSWEDIGKLGTVVGGLVGVVTLVGNPFTVGFTYAGAAAIAAVGGAMWLLGKGLSKYMEIGADKFNGDQFAETMTKLRVGFMALLGDDSNNEGGGVWGALKSLGKTAINTGKIGMAVLQAIGMGQALSSIAKGLGAWANLQNIQLIKGYDKDGNPIYSGEKANVETAMNNISSFLPRLMDPFIEVSNKANLEKSGGFNLFKLVTGNDLSESPFMRGIKASISIGDVLTSIAAGVGAWANLQSIPLIESWDKNGKPIYGSQKADINTAISNLTTFLPQIIQVFSDLSTNAGLNKPDSFNLFKLISGNDLSESPFMRGISASMQIGKVLVSIAGGIGAWANLQNIPLIEGWDRNGKPIYGTSKANIGAALANIQTFLPQIVGAFSVLDEGDSGWSITKALIGTDFGSTPRQRGISNALQISKALSDFASGISVFANLQNLKVVESYDPKTGKPIYSKTPVNIDMVSKNIGLAITSIITAMSNEKLGADIEDAVDNLSDINKVLGGFAGPMKTLGEIKDLAAVGTNLGNTITSILTPFGKIATNDATVETFETFTDKLNDLAKRSTQYESLAKSFKDISSSMGTFATNFNKMTPTSVKSFGDWVNSLTNFTTMDSGDFEDNLKLVKESFGIDKEKTTADAMTESKGGILNYFSEKVNAINPFSSPETKTTPTENKQDNTQLLVDALNGVKTAINAMSAKLDDLDVRVVGAVHVKNDF
jgi:hypothetical protein